MTKRIILLLSILVNIALSSAILAQEAQTASDSTATNATESKQSVPSSLGNEVEKEYNEGNFQRVIELLETEQEKQKKEGLESSNLYYNLGNAYFRTNEIAKALLNYERAALLNPGDKDIRHNIQYANTKIEDKIQPLDTFFLSSWFLSLQNLFSSNTWAYLAIVSFLLFIVALIAFFFSRSITIKKIVFYVGIILAVFIALANIFASSQKNKVINRDAAIIMAGSAPVHSSPDMNSKELFILHSGTKVRITKEDRIWMEIEIADGNIGWIQRDKLEKI